MNKKNNQRFQENEDVMIDVFVEMLKKKPFEKITVKDICEQSLLNRTTFYAHFQDMYELKEHMELRFEKELVTALQEEVNGQIDHNQLIHTVIHEIKKKKDYYQIYFNGLGYTRMHSGFKTLMELGFNQYRDSGYYTFSESDKYIEYRFNYFFDGMIAILSTWLNHNCDLSEDEIANLLFECWPMKETIHLK